MRCHCRVDTIKKSGIKYVEYAAAQPALKIMIPFIYIQFQANCFDLNFISVIMKYTVYIFLVKMRSWNISGGKFMIPCCLMLYKFNICMMR